MIQNTSFPGQVIEGVVGQVYWRCLVGGGFIGNLQGMAFKGISNGHLQVARIAFFSVCAQIAETQARLSGMRYRFGSPQHTIITLYAPMQMIGAIVGSQLISFTINTELPFGDAVAKATNECTKKHPMLLIV